VPSALLQEDCWQALCIEDTALQLWALGQQAPIPREGETLTPINLATWEVEISWIMVLGQPGQTVSQTPSQPVAGCGGIYLLLPGTQ
jgi:hypothetical protein